MGRSVINDISPWNELYFKNCYYSSLFPVLLHFKKSITPVILNDVFVYSFDQEKHNVDPLNSGFELKNFEISTLKDIYKELGFKDGAKMSADLVGSLKSSIDAGCPVMLFIDCFYEKLRQDTYNKNHCGHIILIYGYDDDAQSFNILEHDYMNGFTYDRFNMSYEEADICYKGFLENIRGNGDFSGYIEWGLTEEMCSCQYSQEDEKRYISRFVDNMLSKKAEIYEGLEKLKNFADFLRGMSDSNMQNNEFIQVMLEKIYSAKNAKQVERFRTLKIFQPSCQLSETAEQLIQLWGYIYGSIAKTSARGTTQCNIYDAAMERMKLLVETEYRQNELLFDHLNKWRCENI